MNDRAQHDSSLVMCSDIVHQLLKDYLVNQYCAWNGAAFQGLGKMEILATAIISKGSAGNRAGCTHLTYYHCWKLFTDALTEQLRIDMDDRGVTWHWKFQAFNQDAEEAAWKGLRLFMVSTPHVVVHTMKGVF
jgi:hypothetical protein